MRARLVACVIAAAVLPAALALAGKTVDSKTSLNLGPNPGQFTGVVRADDPRCVAGRRVHVVRVEPGPKQKVARDFSDINGLWSRRTDELSGAWYAKLKPERRGALFCKGDKSPVRAAG